MAGSPEHEADAEWQEFLKSYDQDESILAAVGNDSTEFEEEYGEYLCYSQEMADKIDEINVLGDVLRGTFDIGEKELEKLAEAFDFSVIP